MHQHNHCENGKDTVASKLAIAIAIKGLLALIQVSGGLLSDSMALVADGIHNFCDTGGILVALIAQRISNRAATGHMTYGFARARVLGALFNCGLLVVVGIYLITEAIALWFEPCVVDGWMVCWIAGITLVVDLATTLLAWLAGAKNNINIRALFIHNLADSLGSVTVIIAGALIIVYERYFFDAIATLVIAFFVIYTGIGLLGKCVFILMQAVPDAVDCDKIREVMQSIEGVEKVTRLNLWQLDEQSICCEARILLKCADHEVVKRKLRVILKHQFSIDHATLETRGIKLS
ncbi:cation diffusion facilitator family transporter [Endozoicomonas sp.]|uniref:cation diffusion facilitator family transporter n=1 Tax=Endozoicomonas sp. TaxID=1892382 RepID=UPI0028868ADC|nr:cation diffusion facilitator family transporter [Endozoicomonas sp.]